MGCVRKRSSAARLEDSTRMRKSKFNFAKSFNRECYHDSDGFRSDLIKETKQQQTNSILNARPKREGQLECEKS